MLKADLYKLNARIARARWSLKASHTGVQILKIYSQKYRFSIAAGDLLFFEQSWYVTHAGLLRLSLRRRCRGIQVQPVAELWNPGLNRFAFKATVFTPDSIKGFVGYGDADPSNVSPLVRGAEMRVAETRAVNRALRKAYGIGICSVEEIGSLVETPQASGGLDPNLVKSYAVDFCGTKTLREATREQVENFVAHLADWAEKDRNALLCQLNGYLSPKEGAA